MRIFQTPWYPSKSHARNGEELIIEELFIDEIEKTLGPQMHADQRR